MESLNLGSAGMATGRFLTAMGDAGATSWVEHEPRPPLPWPFFVCVGVVGGALGTVALAYLAAAIKVDQLLNTR